jgi:ABC-2 type transport system ATP-binding protein
MPSSEVILRFKDVSKEYNNKLVLNNINLEVYKGEILGILGGSGSGKTTLLSTLIGFVEPTKGDIEYKKDNEFSSVYDNINDVRQIFGFAAQNPSFYSRLNVKDNLNYFGELLNVKKDTRQKNVKALLSMMKLANDENTPAKNLSGAMQKRLDIACSLIHAPKVLILDEPTAELDPILRGDMWDLIKSIQRRGTSIIIASHFLKELGTMCDRLVIIDKGKILDTGTPDEITERYSKNMEIQLETSQRKYASIIKKLTKKADIVKAYNKKNRLIIYTPKAEKTLHALLHIIEDTNQTLLDIDVNKPNLNEVFESLTKGKL